MWTAGQPLLVLVIFIAAQIADGSLTYWGVTRLGIGVEVNVLIASVIAVFGAAPSLIAAKLLGTACGIILFVNKRYRTLAVAAGTYIGIAVVPWMILFFELGTKN